jgi:NADH/F420H2 dehydrogenase subunit C
MENSNVETNVESTQETPTQPPLTRMLQAAFGPAVLDTHQFRGDETVIVKRESVIPVLQFLRDTAGCDFNFLMDLTIVDYLTYPLPKPSRFEVVYHLYSLKHGHRIRVKAPVNQGETVETASNLWVTADWQEREAWEMFGIKFAGHHNLKRLLTHMDFVGYPLRKDYPLKKRQPLAQPDTMWDEMEERLKIKGLK